MIAVEIMREHCLDQNCFVFNGKYYVQMLTKSMVQTRMSCRTVSLSLADIGTYLWKIWKTISSAAQIIQET